MNISENLARQLLAYLSTHPDPMARMLREQLRYALQQQTGAILHVETAGVYQVDDPPDAVVLLSLPPRTLD